MDIQHEYPGEWLTAPAESDSVDNGIIFVTGRCDVDKFRNNPKFSIRVDVTYTYGGDDCSFPDKETSETIAEVTDRLVATFKKDPVAVLTGIYTGCGQRNWTFYTPSTHIFQRKFNEALADMPTLPITMSAENDPDWAEYAEMRSVL